MNKYEHLYSQHYRTMLTYACSILYDEVEAEDVVQDVWTRILQKEIDVDADRASSYFKRLVHNECVNHINRLKVHERIERLLPLDMDYILSDDEVAANEEKWNKVENYIADKFSPKTQEILNMRYLDNLSYHDMAERLGISTSAINKHLTQALSRLREAFK